MMDEKMVTYAHKIEPNGQRFRGFKKHPLPTWAVNVRDQFYLEAINRDRKGWYAEFEIINGRAVGMLIAHEDIVRDKFSVAIKNDRFNVDIGTGSGVKVTFEVVK